MASGAKLTIVSTGESNVMSKLEQRARWGEVSQDRSLSGETEPAQSSVILLSWGLDPWKLQWTWTQLGTSRAGPFLYKEFTTGSVTQILTYLMVFWSWEARACRSP